MEEAMIYVTWLTETCISFFGIECFSAFILYLLKYQFYSVQILYVAIGISFKRTALKIKEETFYRMLSVGWGQR